MAQLIISIALIALLATQSYAADACTGGTATTAAAGKCCNTNSGFVKGTGVKTCATGTAAASSAAVDSLSTDCLQGYSFASGVCTICAAGSTAANGSTGACTDCPANSFCPLGTAGTADIPPTACPTGSTSAAASDALNDCICTDTTKTLDATSNTAGCVTTYTGTGGMCRTFLVATVGTCTLCRDGYRISSNVCVACAIANCATCDSSATVPAANSEKCLTAKTAFYIASTGTVTACPANCLWCVADGTSVQCTGSAANYYVSSTATAVATACTAGTSSLATPANTVETPSATNALGCPITCSTNCVSCATNGAAKCDVCNNDFVLDATAKTCTALTDTTRDPSCQTAVGTTNADCTACRDADNRVYVLANVGDTKGMCVCKPAFTDAKKLTDATAALADRSVCQACNKNVLKCKNDLTVLDGGCATGAKKVDAMNCALPADKVVGFFYDSTASAWTACDGSCTSCAQAGASFCVGCKDPASTVAPASTDVTTLLKAWSNGTLPATGGQCWVTCPTGYVVDDTRANCVMSSNAVILSLISIIFSAILLI